MVLPTFPKTEHNSSPSLLNLSPPPDEGVQSRMNNQQKPPQFNGQTLDSLRDQSPLNRLGKIEQLAMAEKVVEKNMQTYKKSAFATGFAKAVQGLKPSYKKQ